MRKAHLLHVTGRSSVGGVSVEDWWSPIYQLDLPPSAVQQRPAGGPTLPDRGKDGRTPPEEFGQRIAHLNCHSITGLGCQLCSHSFRHINPQNPSKLVLLKNYLVPIYFLNLNVAHFNQQCRPQLRDCC